MAEITPESDTAEPNQPMGRLAAARVKSGLTKREQTALLLVSILGLALAVLPGVPDVVKLAYLIVLTPVLTVLLAVGCRRRLRRL